MESFILSVVILFLLYLITVTCDEYYQEQSHTDHLYPLHHWLGTQTSLIQAEWAGGRDIRRRGLDGRRPLGIEREEDTCMKHNC